MADKKLNEVTKVTDMAYVPVIMADGSIGQIAKADLASVVAEMIGYIGTNLIADSLDTGKSVDANVPDSCMLMIDAGLGGSVYIYLKRYSNIQLVEQTESENFRLSTEFVSRNTIRMTSIGKGATSIRLKYIKFS